MPPANQYFRDLSSTGARSLEEAYTKEYDARARALAKRWEYYDGLMPEPLKVESDQYNDNILLSKVDQIADKVVSFLLGEGIEFSLGAEEQGGGESKEADQEQDDTLKRLWAASQGDILLHNIALSGAMAGHCFVRVEPVPGQEYPRIVSLDPALCSVFWDALDVGKALWYRLQWTQGNTGKRVDYVRASALPEAGGSEDEEDEWVEITYELKGRWTQTAEQRLAFLPIADWQNLPRPHAYYGIDDVSKALPLNDAINFIASNYNRILKHHGSPKTIGIGMDSSEVVASEIGGFWTVNKSTNEAQIYNLEMQSDLASARELLAIVTREIWQSARLLDPQLVKDSIGQITNFALRTLYQDALAKTATKRLLYEEGFERVNQIALQTMGQAAPEEVKTVWPDVLPEDAAEVGTALLKELEAGAISMQTYREIRGYDNEQENERIEDERDSQQELGDRIMAAFDRGGFGQGRGQGNAGQKVPVNQAAQNVRGAAQARVQ